MSKQITRATDTLDAQHWIRKTNMKEATNKPKQVFYKYRLLPAGDAAAYRWP